MNFNPYIIPDHVVEARRKRLENERLLNRARGEELERQYARREQRRERQHEILSRLRFK